MHLTPARMHPRIASPERSPYSRRYRRRRRRRRSSDASRRRNFFRSCNFLQISDQRPIIKRKARPNFSSLYIRVSFFLSIYSICLSITSLFMFLSLKGLCLSLPLLVYFCVSICQVCLSSYLFVCQVSRSINYLCQSYICFYLLSISVYTLPNCLSLYVSISQVSQSILNVCLQCFCLSFFHLSSLSIYPCVSLIIYPANQLYVSVSLSAPFVSIICFCPSLSLSRVSSYVNVSFSSFQVSTKTYVCL